MGLSNDVKLGHQPFKDAMMYQASCLFVHIVHAATQHKVNLTHLYCISAPSQALRSVSTQWVSIMMHRVEERITYSCTKSPCASGRNTLYSYERAYQYHVIHLTITERPLSSKIVYS